MIFYDGDCGFCNATVSFVLKNRKHDNFLFIPMQSDRAKNELSEFDVDLTTLSTFYFLKDAKLYQKSNAALQLCKELKRPLNLLSALLIVPRPIRDFVYNWIAKRRLRLSKQKCYLPSEEERKLFIF